MDVKTYAKLLNSVGQQGLGPGRKRPLSPVQCAEYIRRMIDEEQESLDKISERLGLGKRKTGNIYKKGDTSMVRDFLNLLKVSKKSRELAGWNPKYPYIPFSTISKLSTMTPEEQDNIIQSTFSSGSEKRILDKEDVKRIKTWRNDNPSLPIQEGIEKVLRLKPVTVVTNMVVVEISGRLRQFVNTAPDYKARLLDMLQGDLPGKFHNIGASKSVMTISMDEEAYRIFHEHQYDRGSSYAEFLDDFLENRVG